MWFQVGNNCLIIIFYRRRMYRLFSATTLAKSTYHSTPHSILHLSHPSHQHFGLAIVKWKNLEVLGLRYTARLRATWMPCVCVMVPSFIALRPPRTRSSTCLYGDSIRCLRCMSGSLSCHAFWCFCYSSLTWTCPNSSGGWIYFTGSLGAFSTS